MYCVLFAWRLTLHGNAVENSATPPVSVYQNFARRLYLRTAEMMSRVFFV